MSSVTSLDLAQMVDLALGTPEIGAVNFNVLHTLLHAILKKLDLSAVTADISKEDEAFLAQKKAEPDSLNKTNDGSIPQTRSPYHKLEDKVEKLSQQMNALNDLPSNAELFEQTRSKGDGEKPRPVADMWQNMQLARKVDNNEEGVSKVSEI